MKLNRMQVIRINILLLLFYFTILIPLFGQKADYYLGPQRYSFIRYDKNILQFPDNDSVFQQLLFRIDSLIAFGKGKIRILHMGGSHIQADVYTHIMRMRLQNLSPDMNGGRGLIFPYNMARTNNPRNYTVSYTGNWSYCKSTQQNPECKLGLTGMAVITTDSICGIAINPNTSDSTHYTFDAVRVYHEPSAYQLITYSSDTTKSGSYDSINHCTIFEFSEPQKIFRLTLSKNTINNDNAIALLGVEFISNTPGIVYSTVGVNGAMLSSYLHCELYQKHLHTLNPDLIIISIGTNDGYTRRFNETKYRNEYRELLSQTSEAVPNAAILLTVPNDSYLYRRYVNTNTEKMRIIIRDLAAEYNCAVWDFYTIMGGLNSAQAWYSLKLMRYDRIHFTQKGYQLKGELFFSAFLNAWESHLSDSFANCHQDLTE